MLWPIMQEKPSPKPKGGNRMKTILRETVEWLICLAVGTVTALILIRAI